MKYFYLFLCFVLAGLCYQLFQQLDNQKEQVARFKLEIDSLSRRLNDHSPAASDAKPNSAANVSTFRPEVVSKSQTEDRSPESTLMSREKRKFAALSHLSSIEGLVVLSPEERKQLLAEFETNAGADNADEILDRVLGPEKTAQVKRAQKELMDQMETEQIENKALVLSKRLNLDSAQEEKLRLVFQDAREKFDYSQVENDQDQSPKDRVLAYLKLAKAKREYLTQMFQQFLSEEQYNSYLALEASSPESQMHDSYTQSLERE